MCDAPSPAADLGVQVIAAAIEVQRKIVQTLH